MVPTPTSWGCCDVGDLGGGSEGTFCWSTVGRAPRGTRLPHRLAGTSCGGMAFLLQAEFWLLPHRLALGHVVSRVCPSWAQRLPQARVTFLSHPGCLSWKRTSEAPLRPEMLPAFVSCPFPFQRHSPDNREGGFPQCHGSLRIICTKCYK